MKSKLVPEGLREKLDRAASGAEVTNNNGNSTAITSNDKFADLPDDKPVEYKKPKIQRRAVTIAFTVKQYNALIMSCTNNNMNLTVLIKDALIKAGYIPEGE